MGWFKFKLNEVIVEALGGCFLGIVEGICGKCFYDASEVEEIEGYKKLALSMLEKAPKVVTDATICESLRSSQKLGLDFFLNTLPAESSKDGYAAAVGLVCGKAITTRFRDVLMGACINLVGC